MGNIRSFGCSCGYKEKLFLGFGRNGDSLDAIKECIPEEIFSDFMSEKNAGNVISFAMSRVLLVCPDCRGLKQVPMFAYSKKDGGEFCYTAPCPVCGKKLEPSDDEQGIMCPKCGKEMISATVGFWD